MTIILAKNAGGTTLADDDGICAGQAVAAGGSLVLNGSLIEDGKWSNPGYGFKVKAVSAGNDSGKTLTIYGKFAASNSVGAYSDSIALTLANASSVTSSLYATEITGGYMATATASSITVGLAADGAACPVGLIHRSLYQFTTGGTFAGASAQIKKYHQLTGDWVAIATNTAAAVVENVEVPAGTTVKAFFTDGTATAAIGISADMIQR